MDHQQLIDFSLHVCPLSRPCVIYRLCGQRGKYWTFELFNLMIITIIYLLIVVIIITGHCHRNVLQIPGGTFNISLPTRAAGNSDGFNIPERK